MPRKKKQSCSTSEIPNSRRVRGKANSSSSRSNSLKSINKEKPQQRKAANARERARMRVLSRAFCRLKTTLPWVPADTKLSKLDTLRLASSYIGHLKGILQDDPFKPEEPMHPSLNLSWPFGFNLCRIGGSNGSGGGGISSGSISDESEADTLDDGISSCSWEEVKSGDCKEQNPPVSCVHLDQGTQLIHHHPSGTNLYTNNNNNNICYTMTMKPSNSYQQFYNHQVDPIIDGFTQQDSMYNDVTY